MAEIAMDIQTKSLEITTSILENINILVEIKNIYIPSIQVNTNEEQIEEEVVITRAKQPKKEKRKKAKRFAPKWQRKKLINRIKLVSFYCS